ncbi:MAG TPA: hypothetical protein VJM33_04700 [Microthrixaceae bacterium]|nr:hypothetical protein [Microthrixaceae bacterium]
MNEKGDGWLMFASVALIFAGAMRVIDGIWAFGVDANTLGVPDLLLGEDVSNYGWWFLIVGILLILAGIGVLSRSQFSRWIGIIGSGIAALSAMVWMPYSPVWALTYIGIAMLVLYALCAYGGRAEVEVR